MITSLIFVRLHYLINTIKMNNEVKSFLGTGWSFPPSFEKGSQAWSKNNYRWAFTWFGEIHQRQYLIIILLLK